MKKIVSYIASLLFVLYLFSSCSSGTVNVFPVKIGEHWGYVSEKGKYLVNPIYESADYFACGLARFVQNGHVGYVNSKGKVVIEPIYVRGTTFSEGKAFVVRDGEAIECINTSGKALFSLDGIEWAYNYHEGLAAVTDGDGKIGFIDEKGRFVIEPKYDKTGNYSEGLAFVSSKDETGYINKKGVLLFSTSPEKPYDFNDGMAIYNIDGSEYGFIDKKGSITIPFQFDFARDFKEGLACVKTGGKYGFVNKKGEYVINPQFEYASSFSNGLASVRQDDRFGYINKKGKMVIEPIFLVAGDFVGEYAFVKNSDGKYGLINRKGDFSIKPQFSEAKDPSNTYAIRSSRFNGKDFAPDFVKRFVQGNWDGLSGSSTLKDIRNTYRKYKSSGDNDLVCETTFEPVDDVKVSEMLFGFGEKTYTVVKKYETIWGFTYQSGTKRQYHDSLPLKSLKYTLTPEHTALSKTKSIAEVLGKEVARVYGVDALTDESSIRFPATESNPYTTLTWTADNVFVTIEF